MWQEGEIELHVSFLTAHEILLIEAMRKGITDLASIMDYVREHLHSADLRYVEALYNVRHREEAKHKID